MPSSTRVLKVHEILRGTLYQRGEFLDVSLETKRAVIERYGITIVVNTLHRRDPELAPLLHRYLVYPFPDGPNIAKHAGSLEEIATDLASEIQAGHIVLTHCHAGRNRSGLLNALVVRQLLRMTGSEALQLVRSRRANAIANPAFVSYLEGMPAP